MVWQALMEVARSAPVHWNSLELHARVRTETEAVPGYQREE